MGVHTNTRAMLADIGEAVPQAGLAAANGVRVLVAEDHEIGLELTCMMARRLGVEADGAYDGHRALQMIREAAAAGRPYALVLMDFMMPVVDGIEATRRLRESGVPAEILPVIALTAVAEPREIGRFTEVGGQGYLPKPLNLDKLSAVFEAWLPGNPLSETVPRLSQGRVLRERYRQRKFATIAQIDDAIEQGRADSATITLTRDLLHKLAGTAGMFGDEALSQIAAECEGELNEVPGEAALEVLKRYRARLVEAS